MRISLSLLIGLAACDGGTKDTGAPAAEDTSSDDTAPIEAADPAGLVDRTYAIDLATARFVEPAGMDEVIATQLEQRILLGVRAADDTAVEFLVTMSVDGAWPPEQDFCLPTATLPPADLAANPSFTVAAHDTTLTFAGYELPLSGLAITGTFAADGSSIGAGTLAGTLDLRPTDDGEPNALCDLVVNFGAECQPCASDGQPTCLPLEIDQIEAEEVPGLVLHEVAGTDCADCATWTPETVPAVEDQVCPAE